MTVSSGGATVCTGVVAADGTWSCIPTVALPLGPKTLTLTATQADATGYASTASAPVTFTDSLGFTSTTSPVGATTASQLSLTLGAPASFGVFTAGVAQDYFATQTANVDGRQQHADRVGRELDRDRALGQRDVRARAAGAVRGLASPAAGASSSYLPIGGTPPVRPPCSHTPARSPTIP